MNFFKHVTLFFLIISSSACIATKKEVIVEPKPIVDIDHVLIEPIEKVTCISIDLDDDAGKMRKLNHFKNAWQIVSLCEVDKSETSTAMSLFYYMWEKEFGDPDKKVLKNLDQMLIRWGEKYKIISAGYSTNGERREDFKAKGVALTKNYVWVKRNKQGDIYKTSLVHELVHASLWVSVGSPDVDHEAVTYKDENYWTLKHTAFIKKVNKILLSLDI
jgi:hypothetical protein